MFAKRLSSMIILNLLPQAAEKQINQRNILNYLQKQILILFFLVLIISFSCFLAKILLKKQFAVLLSSFEKSQSQNLELNNKIKNLNKNIGEFQKIQADFINWPAFIVQFNQLIPKDITILSFNMQSIGNLDLTGIFAERSNFIQFQDNLKNSDFVLEVVSSSKNLLKTKDNDFSLNLKINMEKIKKL